MKFLLLLSLVVFVASGAEGLKCRCSEGECDTRRGEGTMTCPSGEDACYTSKATLYGVTEKSFGCGTSLMEMNCGGDIGICTCATDLCNAAARPGMTTATFALILFAAVAKYVFA